MPPPAFAEAALSSPVAGPAPAEPWPVEQRHYLDYARGIERDHPEHLAALGVTADEYARSMSGPSLTIDESVAAGWMSAAEGRFIAGTASLDDLLELGHSPEEAREILADQQARACAPST